MSIVDVEHSERSEGVVTNKSIKIAYMDEARAHISFNSISKLSSKSFALKKFLSSRSCQGLKIYYKSFLFSETWKLRISNIKRIDKSYYEVSTISRNLWLFPELLCGKRWLSPIQTFKKFSSHWQTVSPWFASIHVMRKYSVLIFISIKQQMNNSVIIHNALFGVFLKKIFRGHLHFLCFLSSSFLIFCSIYLKY